MIKERVEIISEMTLGVDTFLFLDNNLAIYEWNRETSFMQSPALSWKFNERNKFMSYEGEFTPQLAQGFLWNLDDSHDVAKEILELIVMDAPKLNIVAQYQTAGLETYFLDKQFNVYQTKRRQAPPYTPLSDPTFFNLQEYYVSTTFLHMDAFLDSFLLGKEEYKKEFADWYAQEEKKRHELFTSYAQKAVFGEQKPTSNLIKKILDKQILSSPSFSGQRLLLPRIASDELKQASLTHPFYKQDAHSKKIIPLQAQEKFRQYLPRRTA